MSGAEEPVSGRAALAAQLALLQTGLRQRGQTQKAAVEEANRRRRRAAGRPQDLPWPRKDGGVDLSLQAVNDWFPKQKGSKEPSVPADFEDLWSLAAVMLEWTRQLTDKRSGSRLRYDWNKLYEDAQRGTGLDEEVRAYLEAVRKAAEQHPHPGIPGRAAPPLAEVYVRQRSTPLARDGRDASLGDDPAAAGSGPGLPAEAEPAETVFRKADRVSVLIAGPGCGKSTLLRTRLGEAAGEWLGGAGSAGKTGAVVPVWVSARSLAGEETQVPDALAAATQSLSRYGRHPELGTARFLERPYTGAYWQLLVDGLDELPNAAERRAVLEKLANAVAEEPPLYRCVVATRPLTGNELNVLDRVLGHRAPRYDLQPFTPDDLHTYTEKYFGTRWRQEEAARRAQQFTGVLRSASLAELARTPLMSFMLCQLYLAEPERTLPEGRSAVYEAFTDLIYENNHSKHVADSHEEAIKHLAERLQSPRSRREADEAARQVHEQLPELIDYLAHQRLTGHRAPAAATLASHKTLRQPGKVRPELWDAFLEDLLRHTGLLVHDADGLSFPHQTFLEYHAARHADRDQHARRQTLHQLFDPGEHSPGWQNQEPSYLGFLLDQLLTPHDDQISEETKARLEDPTTTGGARKLDFLDFLVQQVWLRTNLPAESTAQQLAHYTTDSAVTPYRRNEAAEALVRVDVEWGARLLETLANDPDFHYEGRNRAAKALAGVDVEWGARLLETLATDPDFTIDGRVWAAEALAGVDVEWGARLLETLATDPIQILGNQMQAAEALCRVDLERGARLLETRANDPALSDFTRKRAAKTKMAVERAARVPETRANDPILNDPTLNISDRVAAAEALARVDMERSTRLLEALAIDPTLDVTARMEAAKALARVDFVQGDPLITDITLEIVGGWY
ncbi:NACHT domain-containing protein [Streptomyces sp. NBC_00724]|uniref:NACHT domain-containing protein n=1 Tax=Streptomyces sp. NBC_00724 TaxID=2975812 RepID=UPI002ED29126|nr:hypothetical protein OHB17_42205 [Streptomyces sp. NBC_00724]